MSGAAETCALSELLRTSPAPPRYQPTLKLDTSASELQTAKRNPKARPPGGVIFRCTNSTFDECMTNRVFGETITSRIFKSNLRPGWLVFLLNVDSSTMYGPFIATRVELNIVPDEWGTVLQRGGSI